MSGLASGSRSPPAWGLSPLREEAPRSPPPATPGALYRSCFAAECEALVLQLGREGGGGARGKGLALPTPARRALTVEAETLTPLEASWSFLAESPPSPGNRTYDKAASLCEASAPSRGPADTRLQDTAEDPCRTFERLPGEASLSFVASTPLPPREGFFQQPRQDRDEAGFPRAPLGDGACLRPSKDIPVRKSLALAVGGQVAAGATSAPGVRVGHGKRSSGAWSASAASSGAAAAKGQVQAATACGGGEASEAEPAHWSPLKSTTTVGGTQALSPHDATLHWCLVPSTVAELFKGPKLPDGRISLSKLPSNKKSRPPSRPSRGPGLLNGLAPPSVGREPKSPGSKLPVRSAAGCDKASQKHPLERRLVKGLTTVQKQSASMRVCPGKRRTEKPACGVLLDTGQIPSAALQNRRAAPCTQCQRLAEENRRLKSMLENCERTITALTQKTEW